MHEESCLGCNRNEPCPGLGVPGRRAGRHCGSRGKCAGNTAATRLTENANAAVAATIPLADQQDFEDAQRGLIAGDSEVMLVGADGKPVWNTADYAFVQGTASPTVNPSLWRQARRSNIHGLFLKQQRDTYRCIHDQTLRLANAGRMPQEIAEELELPTSLRGVFANRGYYGTMRHNAKAVYQAHCSWYDTTPAHLDPLPPEQAAAKYVVLMGGSEAVLRHAREAFERGEYRWAATLLDHLVFAQPDNGAARELLASTYDQLGYQAESGPWRDVYLPGALELRRGAQQPAVSREAAANLLRHVAPERFFRVMATVVNGPRADGKSMKLNFVFTDLGESYVLTIENAVLHYHRSTAPDSEASVTVRLTRDFLVRVLTGQAGLREMIFSDDLAVEGNRLDLLSFFRLLDRPEQSFAIVTP
jgi:alkyl sulfatase BDS1-like metallo-beta-lactamase superfamily hydrolase